MESKWSNVIPICQWTLEHLPSEKWETSPVIFRLNKSQIPKCRVLSAFKKMWFSHRFYCKEDFLLCRGRDCSHRLINTNQFSCVTDISCFVSERRWRKVLKNGPVIQKGVWWNGLSPAPRSLADTAVVNSCVTGINQTLVDMCCVCMCVWEGQKGVCGLGGSNLMSDRSV